MSLPHLDSFIPMSPRLWTFEGAQMGTHLARHRESGNQGRCTRASFHKFQMQPSFGIMLHRQNAEHGTCSAYPAGSRSETDRIQTVPTLGNYMMLEQQNIFACCYDLPERCNGYPEHRNYHPTRIPTRKPHGNLRLL